MRNYKPMFLSRLGSPTSFSSSSSSDPWTLSDLIPSISYPVFTCLVFSWTNPLVLSSLSLLFLDFFCDSSSIIISSYLEGIFHHSEPCFMYVSSVNRDLRRFCAKWSLDELLLALSIWVWIFDWISTLYIALKTHSKFF